MIQNAQALSDNRHSVNQPLATLCDAAQIEHHSYFCRVTQGGQRKQEPYSHHGQTLANRTKPGPI